MQWFIERWINLAAWSAGQPVLLRVGLGGLMLFAVSGNTAAQRHGGKLRPGHAGPKPWLSRENRRMQLGQCHQTLLQPAPLPRARSRTRDQLGPKKTRAFPILPVIRQDLKQLGLLDLCPYHLHG